MKKWGDALRKILCVFLAGLGASWNVCAQELPKHAIARLAGTAEKPLPSPRVLTISADGKTIAAYGEPSDPTRDPRLIRVWEARTGKLKLELKGHDGAVRALSISANGKFLASTEHDSLGLGQTIFWDLATGKIIHRLPVGGRALRLSPEGRSLSIGVPGDFRMLTFDTRTGRETGRTVGLAKIPVHVSPNRKLIAAVDSLRDARLFLFDRRAAGDRDFKRFDQPDRRPPDGAVAVSPDGRVFAGTDGNNDIILWEIHTGRLAFRLKGHTRRVSSLSFSRGGRFLLSTSYDRTIKCWDVFAGKLCGTLTGHKGPIFQGSMAASGNLLATGSTDKSILLWDVTKLMIPKTPGNAPDADGLESLWTDLSRETPSDVFAAVGIALRHPGQVEAFLSQRVHGTVVPAERARIVRLIKQLSDPDDARRYAATQELKRLRPFARPLLLKAIKTVSAEARYRIRRILRNANDPPRYSPGDLRRLHRVVHIMRQYGTPAARKVLEEIIRENPNETVVRDAKEALEDLRR